MVNAGHNPGFLVTASGPPLGLLPGRTYEIETFTLDEGGQVLLYTDGLTEVFQGEEEFGEDRLLDLLGQAPPTVFLDHVWQTLTHFAGNAKQTDDMTALYLHRAAKEVLS